MPHERKSRGNRTTSKSSDKVQKLSNPCGLLVLPASCNMPAPQKGTSVRVFALLWKCKGVTSRFTPSPGDLSW